jgi:hypothetical protein
VRNARYISTEAIIREKSVAIEWSSINSTCGLKNKLLEKPWCPALQAGYDSFKSRRRQELGLLFLCDDMGPEFAEV